MNQSEHTVDFKMYIPLSIGITGHRDIPDEDGPALKGQIRLILKKLMAQYPKTPLVLISSLAEGADRLAAEVAMEKDTQVQLVVALPLPPAEYEKDFESSASREVFYGLLARASVKLEIPLAKGNSLESIRDYGPARDRQYLAAGRFVVEHSQILIALWDGVIIAKVGGTSDVVQFQLTGHASRTDSEESILDPIQTGPVYHVVTRRTSSDSSLAPDKGFFTRFLPKGNVPSFTPFARNVLYPLSIDSGNSLDKQQQRLFKCIEEFNLDVSDLAKELALQVPQSAHGLVPPLTPSSDVEHATTKQTVTTAFSRADLAPSQKALLDRFAVADALAICYQKHTYNALCLIACIVPVIVFFFEVYASVTADFLVITAYLAAMAGAYGVYLWSKRRRNQEKFLDYRALAEGMRVQFFWKLAGLDKSAASYYLNKQQSELDWIRHAVRNWDLLTGVADRTVQSIHPKVHHAIKVYWVQSQVHYFENTAARQKKRIENIESISKWFFWLAIFGLTPAMLVVHGFRFGSDIYDQWIQVVTPIAFVIAGSMKYYGETMLFSYQIKQYVRMRALFDKALDFLERIPRDACRSRDVLLRLGREALAENGDWVLMHRERPIEVPQG